MESGYEDRWIWKLGDYLTCEILEQMADIQVQRVRTAQQVRMDMVACVIDGEYQMQVQFRAEPRLFRRLTERMMGSTVQDEELIREFAKEFVNTLCGRFISEIYRMTKKSARFYPVEYVTSTEAAKQMDGEPFSMICFVSDEQEYAEFSWSQRPMEELLKRSERQ